VGDIIRLLQGCVCVCVVVGGGGEGTCHAGVVVAGVVFFLACAFTCAHSFAGRTQCFAVCHQCVLLARPVFA
jgi:hypothetical protein